MMKQWIAKNNWVCEQLEWNKFCGVDSTGLTLFLHQMHVVENIEMYSFVCSSSRDASITFHWPSIERNGSAYTVKMNSIHKSTYVRSISCNSTLTTQHKKRICEKKGQVVSGKKIEMKCGKSHEVLVWPPNLMANNSMHSDGKKWKKI